MFKNHIDSFKNLEKTTFTIMKYGILFCFLLCIISCIILLTYIFNSLNPFIYHLGLALFKLSIYFMIDFIICGFVVDKIKKHII